MKKIAVLVTIIASFSVFAAENSSIFDSKDLPGPTKNTALCAGNKLSAPGRSAVGQGLDAYYRNILERAYLPAGASEAQKFSTFRSLVGTDADDTALVQFIYPAVARVIGPPGKNDKGLFRVGLASTARQSISLEHFKALYLITFGAYNCDKMHYRGLGEALSDQFNGK